MKPKSLGRIAALAVFLITGFQNCAPVGNFSASLNSESLPIAQSEVPSPGSEPNPIPSPMPPLPGPMPMPPPANLVINSGPTISEITATSAKITWTTNIASKGFVSFGVQQVIEKSTVREAVATTTHVHILTGLNPATKYIFQAISQIEPATQVTSNVLNLTTLASGVPTPMPQPPMPQPMPQPPMPQPTPTGPVILSGPKVTALNPTSVQVDWTVSKPTQGKVRYGTGPDVPLFLPFFPDGVYKTSHSIKIDNLKPSTLYNFQVESTTAANEVVKSPISQFATGAEKSGTMEGLFNGSAGFRVLRPLQLPTNESSGWTYVKDGVWYFFNREVNYTTKPSGCATRNLDFARTVVRASYDKGVTWSQKYVIAEPIPGNADMNCAILDGSTYFDAPTNTWHLLTQCLGESSSWKICHFTRTGASPLGAFTSDSRNPVVRSGQLWNSICGPGKVCPIGVGDEGTPDILYKKDGYYYVTFHGWHPGPNTGYRGIARTADFINWQTSGPGLPGNAIYSATDCVNWNQGCIGGGAATSIEENGFHYMLIEAPAKTLMCVGSENWHMMLVRSRDGVVTSGQWINYSFNPIIRAKTKMGCALQYARLFKDGNDIYLIFESVERNSRNIYILREGYREPVEY